jgi:hypothetical protein
MVCFFVKLWKSLRGMGSSRRFYGTSRKKHGCPPYGVHGFAWAFHQKLLLYDFVYGVNMVLKKPHFGQKLIKSIHFGSAVSPSYGLHIESIKSDGTFRKKRETDNASLTFWYFFQLSHPSTIYVLLIYVTDHNLVAC